MLKIDKYKIKQLKVFGIYFLYDKRFKKEEQEYFLVQITSVPSRIRNNFFIGRYKGNDLELYLNKKEEFIKIGVIENAVETTQIINGLMFFEKHGISYEHPCFDNYIKIPKDKMLKKRKENKFNKVFSIKNFKRVLKSEFFENRKNMIIKRRGSDLVVIKKPCEESSLDYRMTINLKSLFDENVPFIKSLVFFNLNEDFTLKLKMSLEDFFNEYRELVKRKKLKLRGVVNG